MVKGITRYKKLILIDIFILSQYLIFVRGKYVFGDLFGGEQREGKKAR